MFQDITRYVRYCPICLEHKVPPTKPAGHLHITPITAPWKQVTLDLMRPLLCSTKCLSNGPIKPWKPWFPSLSGKIRRWERVPFAATICV